MTRLVVALLVSACLLGVRVDTHELGGSSIAVVVRAGGEAELRLAIPYDEVLHRQVMPRQPFQAFLVAFSAGPAGQAAAAADALRTTLARETGLLADGRPVTISGWTWPPAAAARDILRQSLMMQTSGSHQHPERLVVVATAHLDASARTLQVRVPAILGPALVTISRPREQWVSPGALSAPFPIQ